MAKTIGKSLQKIEELGKTDSIFQDPICSSKIKMCFAEAYFCYLYKFELDQWYKNQEFSNIENIIIPIITKKPSVAVSSVYSLFNTMEKFENRLNPPLLILNIFPVTQNETFVIFSFKKIHKNYFISHISEVDNAEGDYQKYLLSKIIIKYCENFIISSDYYDNLEDHTREKILNFFTNNLSIEKRDEDNPNLFLF